MLLPGSFGVSPFRWWASCTNRKTGKRRDYYMNGAGTTRDDVARHIRDHFRNLEVHTIEQCTSQPTKTLLPVPPEDYEFGYREDVEKEMRAQKRTPAEIFGVTPLKVKPLKIQPIALKRLPSR